MRRNEEHSWKASLMCCLEATSPVFWSLFRHLTFKLLAESEVEVGDGFRQVLDIS